MTDRSGVARVFLSRTENLIVYAHYDQNTLVMDNVTLAYVNGTFQLDLPPRYLYGVVRDDAGIAQPGLQYLGARVMNPGESVAEPAVTSFKGVTDANGQMQVPGLADGKWNVVVVVYAVSRPPKQISKQFEIRPSDRGTVRVDVETPASKTP